MLNMETFHLAFINAVLAENDSLLINENAPLPLEVYDETSKSSYPIKKVEVVDRTIRVVI
jgi:hypothetical protein